MLSNFLILLRRNLKFKVVTLFASYGAATMTHSLGGPPRVLPSTPAASLRTARCSLLLRVSDFSERFWLLPLTSGLCRS